MVPVLLYAALVLQSLQPSTPPAGAPATVAAAYVPQRVYDTRQKTFTDFETMLADLAKADIVFVGEQHDDPHTHRLETAVLHGLRRRGVSVTVSLEMFERDTQAALDRYLAASIPEEEFLKESRPWPRYATDYRPLIELAKANGWPVIASNVPRRYASEVAKTGLEAIEKLPDVERPLVAREFQCPRDTYFDRFAATMSGHPAPGADPSSEESKTRTERYYQSQCVKDETMAESIAAAFHGRSGRPGAIVHFNGAFHSDFRLGAAARTVRRLPGRRVAVVSIIPVTDLDALAPAGEDLTRGDYLVFTVR